MIDTSLRTHAPKALLVSFCEMLGFDSKTVTAIRIEHDAIEVDTFDQSRANDPVFMWDRSTPFGFHPAGSSTHRIPVIK